MGSLTLAQLNALDRRGFVEAVGWVVEHSDWVAERAWAGRPFASVDGLHSAMMTALLNAEAAAQLAVLRAHPDLGSGIRMSSASAGEQSRAGLDLIGEADVDELRRLNDSYRTKFGFPFLLAVKGATIRDILEALRGRFGSAREDEWTEALRQVSNIARFRLAEVFAEEQS